LSYEEQKRYKLFNFVDACYLLTDQFIEWVYSLLNEDEKKALFERYFIDASYSESGKFRGYLSKTIFSDMTSVVKEDSKLWDKYLSKVLG